MRRFVNLGAKLERNLLSYATAASVGLGITAAFSSPAEATVIYTPAHVTITPNTGYYLDLNSDGIDDFRINELSRSQFAILSVKPQYSFFNEIQIDLAGAVALNRGAQIGSGKRFYGCLTCSYGVNMAEVAGTRSFGDWVNVTNRFLGLSFVISGQTHYGWARLTVQVQGSDIRALLTGYAYESIAGKAILAGQKSGSLDTAGSDTAPADPGSLGALAQGSEGLPRWRKRYPAQGSNSEVAEAADH